MREISSAFFKESREFIRDVVQQGASIGLIEIPTGYPNSKGKRYRCLFSADGIIKDLTYTVGIALNLDWDKKFEAIATPPFRSDGPIFIKEEIRRKLNIEATVYGVF